jgi:hypothetical protein
VFGTEAFMVSTSAWVVGCSLESSGLLVSVAAGQALRMVVGGLLGVFVWFGWLFELW